MAMSEKEEKRDATVPAIAETLTKPLFRTLCPENIQELETSELESLCMACHENGVTRLLLTKIPMFRDVVLISFYCPHCGNSNNEIQDSSPIQSEGVCYTITINEPQDMNRLVVKADNASLLIPSLEFEIPSGTQKGSINTLEGFIQLSITDLEQNQSARKEQHPEIAAKIEDFITRLKACLVVQSPYTMVIDDPSGNSFVENKSESIEVDPNLLTKRYNRSDEQDKQLGIFDSSTKGEPSNQTDETGEEEGPIPRDEVMSFIANCSNCQMSAETNMKVVDVPHFKEVVIMASSCEYCGHKSNEVKSGSGICEKGRRIKLHITDPVDLSRDILKAETASLSIPELEFELRPGSLGGRFTTIEGILHNIKDQLSSANPFVTGDTSSGGKLLDFIRALNEVIEGQRLDVHIILDDPAGNSYVQNLYAPDEDPEMIVEQYERNFEQNEELGLNDIKTENY